jgi:tRNA/tmRNA/rRNA uracil-C5-methylase (TrmA/RlmC/RlmD family)
LYDKKFYRQTFCLFIGGQAKVKKGQVYEGIIEKVEFPNKGIVSVEGEEKKVLVKNGIPGQKVRFCVNKLRKGKAEGRLLEVLEKSQLETREPVCSIFPDCGGCMYQTMAYDEQIEMKAQQVKEILDAAIVGDYEFEGVKKSPKEFSYRNKMEFSFGDEYKDGPLSLGLHKKGSTYDVLTAHDCKLVHSDMNKILCCVLNYFKERNVSYYKKMQHVGYLRHLLLRRGEHTGEILVNLVTTTQEDYDLARNYAGQKAVAEKEAGYFTNALTKISEYRAAMEALESLVEGSESYVNQVYICNQLSSDIIYAALLTKDEHYIIEKGSKTEGS